MSLALPGPAARTILRLAALLLIALLAAAAFQRLWSAPEIPVAPHASAVAGAAYGPADYAAALDTLDRDVRRESERAAADPRSWMRLESLALVLHARARLTGSYEDLAAAMTAADRARALAPDASGPVLARAIVAMSLHRNSAASSEIERMAGFAIEAAPADRAEAEAIIGDIALYRGNYGEALRRYRAADALERGPGTLIRLSDWHRHRGEFAPARELLEAGLARGGEITPWLRASYLLQLGALDLQQGEWVAAEARFREADRAFPGWWLAQAHIAQMEAARGDLIAAERRYRSIMPGVVRPSVIEALAAVLQAQQRISAAEQLEARAGELWGERVAAWPEAYADHAFETALRGGDTARAHRLAALNYRSRPYGDARIGLARAAAARGRPESARGVIEELERSGWRSVEQNAALADVCERLGDAPCAASARRRALAINPRAFDPRAELLAFGNH